MRFPAWDFLNRASVTPNPSIQILSCITGSPFCMLPKYLEKLDLVLRLIEYQYYVRPRLKQNHSLNQDASMYRVRFPVRLGSSFRRSGTTSIGIFVFETK